MAKITVNDKSYSLKYGYGALRFLGSMWNCNGPEGVGEKFRELFSEKDGEVKITWDVADKLGDIALAGMICKDDEDLPDRDDVVDAIMLKDQAQMQVVMTAFAESFPKEGNAQPRGKARQTATKKKPGKKN